MSNSRGKEKLFIASKIIDLDLFEKINKFGR